MGGEQANRAPEGPSAPQSPFEVEPPPQPGPWEGSRARAWLMGTALDLLSLQPLPELARPRVHVLCLHQILPGKERQFVSLLEHLASRHELISLPEAIRRIREGDYPRPAIAISFDDGFASCNLAADVLDDFGVKACFFICPGLIGTDGEAARYAARVLLRSPELPFMSWHDVVGLAERGHEIGLHTSWHQHLPGVPVADFRRDLERGISAFADHGIRARYFAWPFGRFEDFSALHASAVFESGLELCASAVRGAHVDPCPDLRALCLRREIVEPVWPLRRIDYLLARSVRHRSGNSWPAGWQVVPPTTTNPPRPATQ